ncbi:hypothetical protein KP509_16G071000 [Ceratopteris richardii]|uniref:PPPDE domain-containing protein n=1 Tax=Ceratopteris richardii TaxID=49495 RepID=A0A8T2T1D1_CERRI|nr:hypothetical protein KP509_16G071000 [Ceratopteris richardii]
MLRTLRAAVKEDMEEEMAMIREPLKLNIYDLTCINDYMSWVGLGIYHSGIEVYGMEYAYGAHDYPTSGIFEVEPQQCPGFKFRKSLTVGTVRLSADKFREFVEELATKYTGASYNMLFKNCNHFCDDVCMRLVNEHIPDWVNRVAKIGSFFGCFSPRSLPNDGILTLECEAHKTGAHTQDELGQLGSALVVVVPKKKHLVPLSAFLKCTKNSIFLQDQRVTSVKKKMPKELSNEN